LTVLKNYNKFKKYFERVIVKIFDIYRLIGSYCFKGEKTKIGYPSIIRIGIILTVQEILLFYRVLRIF